MSKTRLWRFAYLLGVARASRVVEMKTHVDKVICTCKDLGACNLAIPTSAFNNMLPTVIPRIIRQTIGLIGFREFASLQFIMLNKRSLEKTCPF